MVISPHHAMKSWDHSTKWKPKATKRPFKAIPGNRKPPKGKHSAPSSKSALKISKKKAFPGRKPSLVKDDRKSFGEKLRMLSRYTFYRRILQQPSWKIRFSAILSKIRKTGISELRNFLRRRPFGRPIPVWGPAAVGEAPRLEEASMTNRQTLGCGACRAVGMPGE